MHPYTYRCTLLVFSIMVSHLPPSTLFPYTTLFRSFGAKPELFFNRYLASLIACQKISDDLYFLMLHTSENEGTIRARDRKSTRLNSSHLVISYAVFCLKKKKKNTMIPSKRTSNKG